MHQFTYPATLVPDEIDGGFTVIFRDLPEAITQGDTIEECLLEAADCLEEAIAARIDDGLAIPAPSEANKDEKLIPVPLQTAMKAALYLAMREMGISKAELARRLQVDEKEARRILDPRHGTRLPMLERALTALGKRAELRVA
ncbi:MAG: type II toxin-antitoxin system HicB family antitoxin [Halothiobacillaceae bacterium]|nr:type II toxin-antitoxin system HicB family antitoxin [Halothiobacillaceae bacterium]